MGYKWKRLKYHQNFVNRDHNIQAREKFAKRLIFFMEQGKEIISIDESAFTNNQSTIIGWVQK